MTRSAVLMLCMAAVVGCGPRSRPSPVAPNPPAAPPNAPPTTGRCVVTLTDAAVREVKTLQRADPTYKFLRVSVNELNKWKLDLETDRGADDDVCESGGVTVVIDRASGAKLPARVVVDYVDEGGERGFRVSGERGTDVIAAATLPEARKGFRTKLARREMANEPVESPPPKVFGVVEYKSPLGNMAAYLTPDPKDGKKHPAIVWITGGDCNTIGDVWTEKPAANDQTAAAYRKAGVVMMFPSLRGGNQNPGVKESFLGEVDDVLAATEHLRSLPYVDADQVYLGGHSTGGTLALLVAASSDRYRAVFAFGPVAEVSGYGPQYVACELTSAADMEIRSPGRWVNTIRVPTFVFEGTTGGNVAALRAMAKASTNPAVRYLPVAGADHFSVLAPVNKLIAGRVVKDAGPKTNLTFTEKELADLFAR